MSSEGVRIPFDTVVTAGDNVNKPVALAGTGSVVEATVVTSTTMSPVTT